MIPKQPHPGTWFKSSYSEGSGNACVEVAVSPVTIQIRDSKDTSIPSLTVSPKSWSAFLPTIIE
ncbi:DUF397 domain-containing protein [Streptomyces sp. NBC_01317]|uniref:DUF397 domain-containing protein n=1 Tax=Streptomyces sp. NBC_01317 TaxID=2903822 RepID=UPI002E10A303|nr:DUF397 domain-containing protein [Streptomyces sp. NBC_01317]